MSEEINKKEENSKSNDFEEIYGKFFMVGFGLAVGVYACYNINKNTDWADYWDFEKKKYAPIVVNNEIFVMNQKNGKTYILKKRETVDGYFYEYKYLSSPKSKKIKLYSKKDPLHIFESIDNKKLDAELSKRGYKIKH